MQRSTMRGSVGTPAPVARLFSSVRAAAPHKLRRVQRLQAIAAAGALTININEMSLTFPIKAEQATELSTAIMSVMQTFAEKQKAERPKRWESMEFKIKGDASNPSEVEYFEVLCNPNAHATAFDAKVLVTLRTAGGVKIATEGKLTNLKNDVDGFLAQNK